MIRLANLFFRAMPSVARQSPESYLSGHLAFYKLFMGLLTNHKVFIIIHHKHI